MSKLEEIASFLQDTTPEIRLEILADYGNALPTLSESQIAELCTDEHLVKGCTSTVYLLATINDNKIELLASITTEAVIPRGFVGLLYACLEGEPIQSIEYFPNDILNFLHIHPLLGLRRLRGLNAIYRKLLQDLGRD